MIDDRPYEYELDMMLEDALVTGEKVYLELCRHTASPYVDIEENHDLIVDIMKCTNPNDAWNAVRKLQKAQIEYLKKFKEYK